MAGRHPEQESGAGPSWAERARTALAVARAASLGTLGCRSTFATTVVSIEDDGGGRPRIWLNGSSPAVDRLAACRVASVTVAGPGPRTLRLVGSFRMGRPDAAGGRAYLPTLLSVRLLGPDPIVIPVEAFLSAEPDPLREQAGAVLRHLESSHAGELAACVRAHGVDADAVVPAALDRYGIELSAITLDGVRRLRFGFRGGPVSSIEELTTGMRLPLACGCRGPR